MKRFLMATIAVFALGTALMLLVMRALSADMAALGELMRPPAERNILILLLSNLITAATFVWIYSRGLELNKPWLGQGLRFGLAAWLFRPVGMLLINYSVMPFRGAFVVKQLAYLLPMILVLGVTAAFFYRPKEAS